jgi:hypothetical protein
MGIGENLPQHGMPKPALSLNSSNLQTKNLRGLNVLPQLTILTFSFAIASGWNAMINNKKTIATTTNTSMSVSARFV